MKAWTLFVALGAFALQPTSGAERRTLAPPELARPCLELGDLVGAREGRVSGDGFAELYCYVASPSRSQVISSRESHPCELSIRFPNGEMRATKQQLGRAIDGFDEVVLAGGRCFLWEDSFPVGTYEFDLRCERSGATAHLSVDVLEIENGGAAVTIEAAKRHSNVCRPR